LLGNGSNFDRVLRVYSDRAVYTHHEDAASYRERVISKAELSVFKQFVDANNLEETGPPSGSCRNGCSFSEFVVLRKERGRRLFSYNGFGGWIPLVPNLDLLGRGSDGKFHYSLESQIKGLEVLYADGEAQVRDVWQQDDEIRVFAERDYIDEEIKERNKLTNTDEDEVDEVSAREQRRREAALFLALFSWLKFSAGKLAEVTAPPDVYPTIDYSKFSLEPQDANCNAEMVLR
jgi:hypothetical protein